MACDTNFLIQDATLHRIVGLAYRGHKENPDFLSSALGVLNQCGLSEEQYAKIARILGNVPSDNTSQAITEMKEHILAVLSGKDQLPEVIPSGQLSCDSSLPIIPINQIDYDCFSNTQIFLCDDCIQTIFLECQSTSDWASIGTLACVNQHYNKCATAYWKQFDLKLFSPELTILDAKKQGITVDDEPCISKLAIFKWFRKLVPHVENDEGLTLLTMAKGLTLNQLVATAALGGISMVYGWDRILKELGDVPVEQTYVILITNSVFKRSRSRCHASHELLVLEHGCEMPTVQEYVALCVFTNTFFQKCLYGRNPLTYGKTSTHLGDHPWAIGGFFFSPIVCLCVEECKGSLLSKIGAGGRLKF